MHSTNQRSQCIQVIDFRYNKQNEALMYLQRFITLKEEDLAILKLFLHLFQGRIRIITDFLIHLSAQMGENLKVIIERWVSNMMISGEYQSLYSLIDRFVNRNVDQWERKLAEIVYAYYIDDGVLMVDLEQTDYMAAGFCFFMGANRGKNEFRIAEPLVIESIQNYMKSRNKYIIRAMMINIFEDGNSPSEKGAFLDKLIPLSLLLEQVSKFHLRVSVRIWNNRISIPSQSGFSIILFSQILSRLEKS
jgi:hypothetical protein